MTEREYREKRDQYGQEFSAAMGAEAIKQLLDGVDLEGEVAELKEELKTQLVKTDACDPPFGYLRSIPCFRKQTKLDGHGRYPSYPA